ncbi:MAG: endolytic transglycosylase MltG [Negativicutes bacterium]|nr:endolytic transglycosylase MltG [Negativicutes bacterium]
MKFAADRKRNRAIFSLLIFLLLLFGIFGFLLSPSNNATEEVFEVKPQDTVREIAAALKNADLIRSSTAFTIHAHLSGKSSRIRAGSYEIRADMSANTILNKIVTGDMILNAYALTIPEGTTIDEVAVLVEKTGVVTKTQFLDAIPTYHRTDASPEVIYELEGYLYPETYYLAKYMTAADIIDLLRAQFDKVMQEVVIPADCPLNRDEIITLASIIEKESQDAEERALVASVFFNRLAIDMPLQSCATVQYILKEHKDVLSIADTEIDSPYNTYLYSGLPPGPVANPGLAAIEAVLHPAVSDYYYFVADTDGKHHFSKTYEEHQYWTNKIYGE